MQLLCTCAKEPGLACHISGYMLVYQRRLLVFCLLQSVLIIQLCNSENVIELNSISKMNCIASQHNIKKIFLLKFSLCVPTLHIL